MEIPYSLESNGNVSVTIGNFSGTTESVVDLLQGRLGPKRKDLPAVILLSLTYGLIFVSGTVGNICTCIVILRNTCMRTTTNYYLLSLAISDVLILVIGLPPEAYSIWESYPWRFGKEFCIIKSLFAEMTSYASVLTITAFTIERYIAICHPLKSHKIVTHARCIKIIIAIWIISLSCALPYPIHTDLFFYLKDSNNVPILASLQCNIPPKYYERMIHVFQLSTFVFFVFPLTVIVVLYSLIGLTLRRADLRRKSSEECNHNSHLHPGTHNHHHERSPASVPRKSVLKVLVAVVVAFFVCWAPFHAQRLLTIYNTNWTPILFDVQSTLFYISGVLYFVGSTVNPILYNVMSRRYRLAFVETICNFNSKHTYGSLRAINGGNHHRKIDDRHHLNIQTNYENRTENIMLTTPTHTIEHTQLIAAENKHAAKCALETQTKCKQGLLTDSGHNGNTDQNNEYICKQFTGVQFHENVHKENKDVQNQGAEINPNLNIVSENGSEIYQLHVAKEQYEGNFAEVVHLGTFV